MIPWCCRIRSRTCGRHSRIIIRCCTGTPIVTSMTMRRTRWSCRKRSDFAKRRTCLTRLPSPTLAPIVNSGSGCTKTRLLMTYATKASRSNGAWHYRELPTIEFSNFTDYGQIAAAYEKEARSYPCRPSACANLQSTSSAVRPIKRERAAQASIAGSPRKYILPATASPAVTSSRATPISSSI